MKRNWLNLQQWWNPASGAGQDRSALAALAAPADILQLAMRWIDAALNLYLQRTAPAGNDLAGLAVSRSTIEQLLNRPQAGAAPLPAAQAQAQARMEADAEAARNALFEAIRSAPANEQPLADLCQLLALDALEIQTLLLCLAPELDSKYQRIYGYVNDDLGRRHASPGLIAALLPESLQVRSAMLQNDRLLRWRILGSNRQPWADDCLRIDASLVAWLLGQADALLNSPLLEHAMQRQPWPGANWLGAACHQAGLASLQQALMPPTPPTPPATECAAPWLVLATSAFAPGAAGKRAGHGSALWRALLERAAQDAGLNLLRINMDALDGIEAEQQDDLLARLGWIARLAGALPAFDCTRLDGSSTLAATLRRAAAHLAGLPQPALLLLPHNAAALALAALPPASYRFLPCPDEAAGKTAHALYRAALLEAGLSLPDPAINKLALAYDLPIDALAQALHLAQVRGASAALPVQEQAGHLVAACRQIACPGLPHFATLLEPKFRLQQVVLPQRERSQLDDIVAQVLHSERVLHDWGFAAQLPYGRGVAALFSGPSGTGKTMAACAIGQALERIVFAVDLSRVVSKYIGETEKNLDMVFDDAQRAGAVLLFDEADALFGKRSDVKDAHDRYANIETAYLLQRMEAFDGLAILTSNLGQNLDRAFLRRLRFVVEFPLPDAMAREQIWRQCFPPEAPLAADVDFRFLARRVEITGGHIRQITLRAAFMAAAQTDQAGTEASTEASKIGMHHILQATRAEATKLGMPGLERELAQQAA